MAIEAAEISAILKDQIKNLAKKLKFPKLGAYSLLGTVSREFTG